MKQPTEFLLCPTLVSQHNETNVSIGIKTMSRKSEPMVVVSIPNCSPIVRRHVLIAFCVTILYNNASQGRVERSAICERKLH